MKFLNGFKAVLGLVGLVLTPIVAVGGNIGKLATDGVAALGPLGQTVEGAFGVLLAVGLAHKTVKAQLKNNGIALPEK